MKLKGHSTSCRDRGSSGHIKVILKYPPLVHELVDFSDRHLRGVVSHPPSQRFYRGDDRIVDRASTFEGGAGVLSGTSPEMRFEGGGYSLLCPP